MTTVFRYILTIAFVAICGTLSAQHYHFTPAEQPKVRVEMGIGLDGVYTNILSNSAESVSLKPRLGFGGHLDLGLAFGRFFAVETEISYQRTTIVASNPRDSYKIKTTTMDIPLLLSLRLANKRLRLNVGPLFTVMNKAQYSVDGTLREYGNAYPTWNAMASVGICLGSNFMIEGRYIYALADTLNHFEGEEFRTRANRISVGFSVIF